MRGGGNRGKGGGGRGKGGGGGGGGGAADPLRTSFGRIR
jgi:ATP-dependent RNA helicase RhlE